MFRKTRSVTEVSGSMPVLVTSRAPAPVAPQGSSNGQWESCSCAPQFLRPVSGAHGVPEAALCNYT